MRQDRFRHIAGGGLKPPLASVRNVEDSAEREARTNPWAVAALFIGKTLGVKFTAMPSSGFVGLITRLYDLTLTAWPDNMGAWH